MDKNEVKKILEAFIFSSSEPLNFSYLDKIVRNYCKFDTKSILEDLVEDYSNKGFNLICVKNKWFFRTSPLLNSFLSIETEKKRKLSQSTMETLAIIAYHQPTTRAEIEKIRGKPVFKGTLDVLLDLKWIKPQGRKETPGRPVLWVTDFEFLKHFGLKSINDLPRVQELESLGLES
tara:strand:+ start:319 stop:846 length:528 start_codon:yes stop_codon:yes gene_type:complete